MKTLDDLIAERSQESKARIRAMSEKLVLEWGLQQLREELAVSQTDLAAMLDISQPAVAQIERRGNDIKLTTLKRYIEALGGQISLKIEMPDGIEKIIRL